MGKSKFALIFSTSLIFISIGYLFFVVFQNLYLFTKPFNFAEYERRYNQSQWVIPNSKNPISDEDLYAYAGYKYVRGLNPILLNPEAPPLGKYMIGLSILVFDNQRVVSLILAFFSLFLIFLLVYKNISSLTGSSFAVFLTSINTLFIDQFLHAPQLDIFQLFFLLLFFFIFQKLNNYKYLVFAGIFFGGFISIKFFLVYFSIINISLIIFYFLKKQTIKKSLSQIAIINGIGLSVYLLTYARYFILGGTLRSFLGTQKWITLFYSSAQIDITKLIGNYLNLIFFNKWRFWTEGYPIIHYQYWSILWPIIFMLGIFSTYKLLKNKKTKTDNLVLLLISFLNVYNIFLFIIPVYPRYLLLLFVPINILITIYFAKIIKKMI